MTVLGVVTARCGSKGIPDKNVLSFLGKPLLVHSIEHGLKARNVDRVLVTTDSEAYRGIALDAGADAPFLRPAALARDHSTDLEVFTHALEWLEAHEGYRPDACVHLRPTYPTRRVQDVEAAVELLARNPSADSVRSVSPAEHTPYKMWRLVDGALAPVVEPPLPDAHSLPRQLLPPVYAQNAAVDVVRARVIREEGSMTGRRVLPYLMEAFHDIDDWPGFASAERAFAPGDLPEGRTFAFDLDGTIANLVPGDRYLESEAYPPAVELVNRLHDAGNRIVVYTARGSHTGIDWRETTREQLRRWGVRHHELRFGKPAADYFVDDRMMSLATLRTWMQSCEAYEGSKSA
jgi:CMP-N,N'-diacetyllegionaminic acid synthase